MLLRLNLGYFARWEKKFRNAASWSRKHCVRHVAGTAASHSCPAVRFHCVNQRERSFPVSFSPQTRYASERIPSVVFHSHRLARTSAREVGAARHSDRREF